MATGNGKQVKSSVTHPFAKKDPKPTRARLVSLLDPLGRKRYSEVERFLATIAGANSGLFYYGTNWGWAVRYLLGAKSTLCTLHLLPNLFEATVPLGKESDEALKTATFPGDLKRRMTRVKPLNGTRHVRLPIKNDADYASFQFLINLKSEALRSKKTAKATKAPKKDAAVGVSGNAATAAAVK